MRKAQLTLICLPGLLGLSGLPGCKDQRPPAAQRSEPPAQRAPPQRNLAAPCVDRYLVEHGLNPFGDAPGTAYAGGSPLFDERTGLARDRVAAVLSRHPEIARACSSADAGPASQAPRDGAR